MTTGQFTQVGIVATITDASTGTNATFTQTGLQVVITSTNATTRGYFTQVGAQVTMLSSSPSITTARTFGQIFSNRQAPPAP